MMNAAPKQVTTDGHDSYPRAIREVLGANVEHRCSAYLNRRIEQDHRGVKQRYYPMLGFGAFSSAQRFCRAFEEIRQYFRPRRKRKQFVSLAQRRRQFTARAAALASMFTPPNIRHPCKNCTPTIPHNQPPSVLTLSHPEAHLSLNALLSAFAKRVIYCA